MVSVSAVLDGGYSVAEVEEVLSDALVPFCLGGICCGGGSAEPAKFSGCGEIAESAKSSLVSRAAAFSFLR